LSTDNPAGQRAIDAWRSLIAQPAPTLAQKRANIDKFFAQFPATSDVKVQRVGIEKAAADWLTLPTSRPSHAILYIHGGAYLFCSSRDYRDLASRIARASSARALVLDYRLAPEHPFPAALDDSVAASHFLLAQGLEPSHIALVGDSAGACLALNTVTAARAAGLPTPAAVACISPWVDLECNGPTMITKATVDPVCTQDSLRDQARQYLNGKDPKSPQVSPLYADLHNFPPLLIQVGSEETLLDDAHRLDQQARSAGVSSTLHIYPGDPHIFPIFSTFLPESLAAISENSQFLQTHFG
jgi:epsilon-lactone hydrolase